MQLSLFNNIKNELDSEQALSAIGELAVSL